MLTNSSRDVQAPSRLRLAMCQLGLLVGGFFFLRVLLYLKFGPHGAPLVDVLRAFAVGFHIDLFVGLVFASALLLWLALFPVRYYPARWHRILLTIMLGTGWTLFLFLLVAE